MSPFQPWAHGLDEIRFQAGAEGFGAEALAELLENVPLAIAVTLGPDHHCTFTNRLYRSVWSDGRDSLIGRTISEILGDRYTPEIEALRQRVLDLGEPCELSNMPVALGPDRVTTYWDLKLLPVRLGDDRIGGVMSLAAHVTERVRARREADRQAQEAELYNKRLALAVEATELGLWEWDALTGRTYWSDRQKQIFGLRPEEDVTYKVWLESLHPEDRDQVVASVSALQDPKSGGRLHLEHRLVRPDGEIRWIVSQGRMLYEIVDGVLKPARLLGTIFDITERRRNEEARQLLVQELNHRVKNLFAMVSGMVALTARRADNPKDMAAALKGRLDALARAHELIQPAIAEGELAGSATSVDKIVSMVLAPHDGPASTRIIVEGPPAPVSAHSAIGLTLVLHELATNASKYGALSVDHGHVRISWAMDARMLVLLWQEENGPIIEGPPATEGFGSLLARKSVKNQLGGEIVHNWRREGLQIRIGLPLDQLARAAS